VKRRTLPLTSQLVDALRHRRQVQRQARTYAGSERHNSGLVFTTVTGRQIDPRQHSLRWTAFLVGAGVRPVRLQWPPVADGRHRWGPS
jgi:integrase